MGLITDIWRRKYLHDDNPANKDLTYRIYLVRAGAVGILGGLPGLSEEGMAQMTDLAANLQHTHEGEKISIFSLGGYPRQMFSANVMAKAIGTQAVHLRTLTLSELNLEFGELSQMLRRKAEEGTRVFVLVAAQPSIQSLLKIPWADEASAHHLTIRSRSRGIPTIITLP